MTEWSEDRRLAGDRALDAFHEALRRANPGVKIRPRRVRKPKPIITSSEEIAVTTEHLGSLTVGGVAHAAYPSALSALCGLRIGATAVEPAGPAPDCLECSTMAAHCAAIDASAPKHWDLPVAVTEGSSTDERGGACR